MQTLPEEWEIFTKGLQLSPQHVDRITNTRLRSIPMGTLDSTHYHMEPKQQVPQRLRHQTWQMNVYASFFFVLVLGQASEQFATVEPFKRDTLNWNLLNEDTIYCPNFTEECTNTPELWTPIHLLQPVQVMLLQECPKHVHSTGSSRCSLYDFSWADSF